MKRDAFNITGILVRTSNKDLICEKDIGALWQRFFSENIMEQIPNKVGTEIYSVYTDYEGDHTAPYSVIIGCKVSHLKEVPEGMVGKEIPAGDYSSHLAKGSIPDGAIGDAWKKIWEADLDRAYTADYEIYGPNAQNPHDAEVEIQIALK